MKRYPSNLIGPFDYTRYKICFKNEQIIRDFMAASSFLHYFYVKRYGRCKKRHDHNRYASLDDMNIIVNQFKHVSTQDEYGQIKRASFKVDESLEARGIEFLFVVPTEEDRQELLKFSHYLSNWVTKCRGKGTKKHGSVVYRHVQHDTDYAIESILFVLKSLRFELFANRIIVNAESYNSFT